MQASGTQAAYAENANNYSTWTCAYAENATTGRAIPAFAMREPHTNRVSDRHGSAARAKQRAKPTSNPSRFSHSPVAPRSLPPDPPPEVGEIPGEQVKASAPRRPHRTTTVTLQGPRTRCRPRGAANPVRRALGLPVAAGLAAALPRPGGTWSTPTASCPTSHRASSSRQRRRQVAPAAEAVDPLSTAPARAAGTAGRAARPSALWPAAGPRKPSKAQQAFQRGLAALAKLGVDRV